MTTRRELADAIRFLAIDAVQQANSGHPGMPMGMADIAEVLWNDFLKHNPINPSWINRDRFILSNGHGAMLQYALLHLTGYDLSITDLKAFRQLHSKTPGHPEHGYTPGIETTTGPLGQGLANGVGMAIAEKILATQFNRPGHTIIDHHTYVFVGDGCLMEGISHEVSSLAGTLGLGKLIVFWDDNEISIDGHVSGWFTTDIPKRFQAYNWQVIAKVDGHNPIHIKQAIEEAKAETARPTLICCKTTIGYGSPNKAGTAEVHGAPLGVDEVAKTRENLKWNHPSFEIPTEIYKAWNAKARGQILEESWQKKYIAYQLAFPEFAKELARRLQGNLSNDWPELINNFLHAAQKNSQAMATRKASGDVLQLLGPKMPELLGGSADLSGSNNTLWKGAKHLSKDNADANYIFYGVREFGMSAIMNGIALHGGFIPYGGTFLVFQTYAANATRMSALMHLRVIYIFTHDSIGLGEDGPTHQPIVEAATLRMTPHMTVWRPCDLVETIVAWQLALENKEGPTSLLLTRQNTAAQTRDEKTLANIKRGGYILSESDKEPEVILIATGSEVELAMQAALQLQVEGCQVRVVSMPSCEVFTKQELAYQESVLPSRITKRIAIEASCLDYWYKFVGLQGRVIGMKSFGVSAPYKEAYNECGITVATIVKQAKELLQ
ncbi:MAG: transketolase [Gammaproteobacteria bacterium RIFCSPHIGHO2_12_FULL_35_23]|nr:MAG: transketolase [Gammaproteobacteria bacterium RIFCSPHIGHO2_12_FULL_35_23]